MRGQVCMKVKRSLQRLHVCVIEGSLLCLFVRVRACYCMRARVRVCVRERDTERVCIWRVKERAREWERKRVREKEREVEKSFV